MNRIIINDLAAIPALRLTATQAEQVRRTEEALARYGARIVWHDLSDELLKAVDRVLGTEGGARQAAIDQLRAVRFTMQDHEKRAMRK